MAQFISLNTQNRYELKFHGQPDDSLLCWFRNGRVQVEMLADDDCVTVISDVVMDQAGLVGLIRQLHGHGIVLLSIVGRGEQAVSQETQND